GLDITQRMIELAVARARAGRRQPGVHDRAPDAEGRTPHFLVGDMGSLPTASGVFDAVTTGYGLRNVPDLDAALREIHRVLKPDGVLGSLDFNRPESAVMRTIFLAYLTLVGGALGWVLHRDPDTYRYIPASIRRYPGARGVADLMREAGFANVR